MSVKRGTLAAINLNVTTSYMLNGLSDSGTALAFSGMYIKPSQCEMVYEQDGSGNYTSFKLMQSGGNLLPIAQWIASDYTNYAAAFTPSGAASFNAFCIAMLAAQQDSL
jgi:hypothetical protein